MRFLKPQILSPGTCLSLVSQEKLASFSVDGEELKVFLVLMLGFRSYTESSEKAQPSS